MLFFLRPLGKSISGLGRIGRGMTFYILEGEALALCYAELKSGSNFCFLPVAVEMSDSGS